MASKAPRVAAKSIRALAKLVSKSESAVRKWKSHQAWAFSQNGPWDVE